VPFLHRKAVPSAAFEPKFEALESVLDAVARLVETKSPNDKKKDFGADENEPPVRHLTKLASAVHGYRAVLYAYLAEKEKVLVPTLRAFFTPEEVFAAFAEVLRKTPRAAFGSLVHHLAGGEEAVKAFNARSVVSRSWRFGYGETVKHRAEYRAKMEFLLERLLAGDERLGKNKSAFGATNRKTTLERVNALTPLDLNERLVVNPTSSEALALAIADELGSGRGTVAGADVARSRTSQTKARLVNLAIGV
jgi:hypothetical protein